MGTRGTEDPGCLPVASKDALYWDAGLPGFGVKMTSKGRKVFLVMYRVAGAGSRLSKYTIGPYEAIDAGAFSRAAPLPEKFWRHNRHGENGAGQA